MIEGIEVAEARTGKIKLRSFEPADLDGALQVHSRAFGDGETGRLRERWSWAQEDNLYPDETHRWVLDDGARIVGFLTTIPQPYRIGGRIVVAHTPCDYVVAPEHRFHGLKLMRAFAKRCPNCVTFDDVEATIAVNTWLRIKPIARFESYMLPLSPRMIARTIARVIWRRPSLPLGELARCLLRPRSRFGGPSAPVEVTTGLDARFDRFADELAGDAPAMVSKDRRFLEWRYRGASPHKTAVIVTVPGGADGLAGYAILYHNRRGSRRGAILDLQTRPGDQRTLTTLLRYATAHFRRHRVERASYQRVRPGSGPNGSILRSHGLIPVETGLQLMVKLEAADQMTVAAAADRWSLSFGDTETSHHQFTAE